MKYLMNKIRKLREGTTTAANAHAVANVAGKYFNSIKHTRHSARGCDS